MPATRRAGRPPPRALLLVLAAVLGGLSFQLLLGGSYVAAFLDPVETSTGMPLLVVDLDDGPLGDAFLDRLSTAQGPVVWVPAATREEAIAALEQKEAFGALVLPANFSESLGSFGSDAPRAATVEILQNPGASTAGNVVATRVIDATLERLRDTVRERALASAALATTGMGALTLEQARFIAQPVHAQTTVVNPVPSAGANGLAPTYLAMACWMGGYLGAAAFERFRPMTRLRVAPRAGVLLLAALGQSAALVALLRWIGLAIPDPLTLTLVLAAGTWMAYAVVCLVVDVFGMPGVVPAFAVLALGLPASGAIYPVEMLPPFFAALHPVSPFTWLVEALRTTLYAPYARDLGGQVLSLGALAVGATLASLAWSLARRARPVEADAAADEPLRVGR